MLDELGRYDLSEGIAEIINKYADNTKTVDYYKRHLDTELEYYVVNNYYAVKAFTAIDFDAERVKSIIFDTLTTLQTANYEPYSSVDVSDVLLLAILLGLKYRYDDKINYLLDLLVVMLCVRHVSSGIADFWIYAYDLDDLYGNASIDYWSGQEITYLEITDLGKLIDAVNI